MQLLSLNFPILESKSFHRKLFEAMYEDGWISLADKTNLMIDDDSFAKSIIEILCVFFEVKDINDLVYCNMETGAGYNFHFMYHKIHELKPKEMKQGVSKMGERVYIAKFELKKEGVTVCQINTTDGDGYQDSLIVVKKEDLSKLDPNIEKQGQSQPKIQDNNNEPKEEPTAQQPQKVQ